MSTQAVKFEQHRTAVPDAREIVGRTENLRLSLISDPAGVINFTGSPYIIVSIHVGKSVYTACRRLGLSHRGTNIHGDIEIIPAHTPGVWEINDRDTALVMGINPELLKTVVEEWDVDPRDLEIRNRFQARDQQMEHIAWALKAEMENGYPSGRLYIDSLSTALAARLVRDHSTLSTPSNTVTGGMSGRKLKELLSFIEDNLSQELGLSELARVADLSTSHLNVLFRQSVGMPVHQYVIRRRVERAATLLRDTSMSIGEVALEAGFSHQSHLASHMRRVMGITPRELKASA